MTDLEPRTRWVAGTVLVALVVAMLLMLSARRIWTVDYWWQWKTGEYVAHNEIPRTDVFSYTRPDHPRLELRWAYCLGLYRLSDRLGHGSAVVFKCAAIVATFLLAALIYFRPQRLVWTCAVVSIAALAASQRFYVRPEALTHLFLVVFLAIVALARRRRTRWIWLLPPLTVVWVNVHGLFVLGPAVVGAWLTAELIETGLCRLGLFSPDDDRRRRLVTSALLLGATFLAALVNPYLHRAALLPVIQFAALHGTAQKDFFVELLSPFSFEQSYTAIFYYKLLLGITLATLLIHWKRQCLFWLILIVSFGYLSITAVRNVPLFALVAIPFILRIPSGSPTGRAARLERWLPSLRLVGALGVAALCVYQSVELYTNRFNVKQSDTNRFGIGIAEHRYPAGGTEFLLSTGVDAPIFNTPAAGSYLLAHDVPVFIDPRGEVYLDGVIDEYREITAKPATVGKYVDKYDFGVFFIESTMLGLIRHLHSHPDWRLVYIDEVSIIAFRIDVAPGVPALDLESGGGRWLSDLHASLGRPADYADRSWLDPVSSPAPYVKLARLGVQFGVYGPSRRLFEDARRAYPASFGSWDLLAFATAQGGDADAAAGYYVEAIDRDPRNTDLRKRSAWLHQKKGDLERARVDLDVLLEQRPRDAAALAMRGIVGLQLGQPAAAVESLERAIAIRPDEGDYHYYLGQALIALRRTDAAVAMLERAFRLDPESARTALTLAEIHSATGRPAAARRWLTRATELAPGDPRIAELQRRLESP